MNIFKRWAVRDNFHGQILPERFLFKRDAQDLAEAIKFLYILDETKNTNSIVEEYEFANCAEAVRV